MWRSYLKSNAVDWLIVLILVVYSLFIWWPTRYLPFHWDSAGFYINAAKDLAEHNFQPLVVQYSDFAHPPLLILISALIWRLTQGAIIFQHLVMLPFLPLLLISTYFVGKKLGGSLLGLLSAFLLGLLPVTLAEYGVVYIDLPSAALVTAAICLWLYAHRAWSIVFLTLAVLTKDLVLILLPLFIYFVSFGSPPNKRRLYLLLGLPVLALLIYLIYHYQVTGWWLIAPQTEIIHRWVVNLNEFNHSLILLLQQFGLNDARWLLTIPGFLSICLIFTKHRRLYASLNGRYVFGFILQLLITLFFFTVVAEFTPRYALFLFPILIITCLWAVFQVLNLYAPDQAISGLILYAAIVAVAFILNWYPALPLPDRPDFRPPADLSYRDQIYVFRTLGTYLSIYETNSQLFGSFPENAYFTQPHQGYVYRPLTVSPCQDFVPNPAKRQLVILHNYSPGSYDCRQISSVYPFIPLTKFESGSQKVGLYQISATASATPTP